MNLKPAAVNKLRELIAEEANPALMLRVFVQGGAVQDSVMDSHLMKFKMKMILISITKKCEWW